MYRSQARKLEKCFEDARKASCRFPATGNFPFAVQNDEVLNTHHRKVLVFPIRRSRSAPNASTSKGIARTAISAPVSPACYVAPLTCQKAVAVSEAERSTSLGV